MGSKEIHNLKYRESFAFIGIKGKNNLCTEKRSSILSKPASCSAMMNVYADTISPELHKTLPKLEDDLALRPHYSDDGGDTTEEENIEIADGARKDKGDMSEIDFKGFMTKICEEVQKENM